MKKILFSLVLTIVLKGCATKLEVKRPLLWKVEKDGKISYALGTAHIDLGLENLPPIILQKLNESDYYLGEGKPTPSEFKQWLLRAHSVPITDILKEDHEMQSYYDFALNAIGEIDKGSKSNRIELQEKLRNQDSVSFYLAFVHDLDKLIESRWNEWAKSLYYYQANYFINHCGKTIRLHSSEPGAILDFRLEDHARSLGQSITRLDFESESFGNVKSLIADMIHRNIQNIIEKSFKKTWDYDELINHCKDKNNLMNAFARGEDVYDLLKRKNSLVLHHELEYFQVGARNKAWMKHIIDKFEKGRAFLAVGALHFEGSDGLIELLRMNGFNVSRI
jgi:hypothetical protein